MATVQHWSGLEARALRLALRMSVRAFAGHLGVAVGTVSKWERLGIDTQPRPDTQAILDTALARSDIAVHLRFETLLSEAGRPAGPGQPVIATSPRMWDYETWTDDLDRTVVALSRQNFTFASHLLTRWLTRWKPTELDDTGLYLFARSTALLGDLQRDQGILLGPLSAHHSYSGARSIFAQLDIPRRVAQLDLSLTVVTEMSGKLDQAAQYYETLAVDDRLSGRDRARSRLWVGTALSKHGHHDYAIRVMTAATREFDHLGEADDWSVAHQKIALAHRGTGELTKALHFIDIARSTAAADSPMQRVRLDTAYGHILLSDRATMDDGLSVLDQAARAAAQYGLAHQLRSIETIRQISQGGGTPAAVTRERS